MRCLRMTSTQQHSTAIWMNGNVPRLLPSQDIVRVGIQRVSTTGDLDHWTRRRPHFVGTCGGNECPSALSVPRVEVRFPQTKSGSQKDVIQALAIFQCSFQMQPSMNQVVSVWLKWNKKMQHEHVFHWPLMLWKNTAKAAVMKMLEVSEDVSRDGFAV